MTRILAIDPGNVESGWCLIDPETRAPIQFGKSDNYWLLNYCWEQSGNGNRAAIEMVASYGMAVGADVFETCVWIGRFQEAMAAGAAPVDLIKRHPVKMHHCCDSRAKDSNIIQALVDRFAKGQPNRGKGTKAQPGWFYGFRADIWQAYALAVYAADTMEAVS